MRHWLCTSLLLFVVFGHAPAFLWPISSSSRRPIWTLGYMSMTGGKWDAGLSVSIGVEMMLQLINDESNLLPNHELKIVWQDTACDKDKASEHILANLFEQTYAAFAPGRAYSQLDTDGSGRVTGDETQPYEEIWDSTTVHPPPVALLGATCSDATERIVNTCYYANLPIISGSSTAPALSNRETFPNFYRTVLPDTALYPAWLAFAKLAGHTHVVPVIGTDGLWTVAAGKFAEVAKQLEVSLDGLDTDVEDFRGLRITDNSDSVADAVRELVRMRRRFVVLLENPPACRNVLCAAYHQGFRNAVWMTFAWFQYGWWDTATASCPTGEIAQMVPGLLAAGMQFWRPLDDPTPLTCAPNVTTRGFYTEWWRRMNQAEGVYVMNSWGFSAFDDAASWADAACMLALALHQMLEVNNFQLTDLSTRTTGAYAAIQELLSNADFEGLQGQIHFEPGLVEPTAAVSLSQLQLMGGGYRFVDLATFAGMSFTFLEAEVVLPFPGESFSLVAGSSTLNHGVQHFLYCPENKELDFSTNRCQDCPANYDYVGASGMCMCKKGFYLGTGGCEPCAAGNYSRIYGAAACKICDPGTTSTPGSEVCTVCELGRFGDQQGMSECTKCPENLTTVQDGRTDQAACVCAFDSYSDAGVCVPCPPSAITEKSNSSSVSACKCPINHYMSVQQAECINCPERSRTVSPGQTEVGQCLCEEGTYLQSSTESCKPCPDGMTCPEGSNEANGPVVNGRSGILPSLRNQYQQFPLLLPNHWSSLEHPLLVYRCRETARCPGFIEEESDPDQQKWPGNACADRLVGIACEHCEDGFAWTGTACASCSGMSSHTFFPVFLVLLLPAFVAVAYKFFRDPLPKWGSWGNSTAALLFILLNHTQVLGILAQSRMQLPDLIHGGISIFAVSNDFSSVLSLECIQLGDLFSSTVAQALYPVACLIACIVAYLVSHGLARILQASQIRMEKNRLFNVFGSIMFTFFGAISGMSLLLFKCSPNPTADQTLAKDLSVICWHSPAWTSSVGVGIACVFVYIIGMGGVFIYAIYLAPYQFADKGFQMRWKFLFIKFHSGAYWWGMVILLRNFLVNMVPVVWTQEVSQLYIAMSVILAYLSGVYIQKPYRAEIVNYFEMLSGVCIVYVTSLLTWHANRIGGRFDWSITLATVFITCLPTMLLPCVVVYLMRTGQMVSPTELTKAKARKDFQLLKVSFEAFLGTNTEEGLQTLLQLGDSELHTLQDVSLLLNTDILGEPSRQRLSSGTIYHSGRHTNRLLPERTSATEASINNGVVSDNLTSTDSATTIASDRGRVTVPCRDEI